jgi:hypothetical protein
MIQTYDEFSVYTTYEDVKNFVNELIDGGIVEDFEIYERCVQNFGRYFNTDIDSLYK